MADDSKVVFDRLVIADEQGHLQGKPLEGVTAAITAAVEKDREAHQDIAPERIAKAQGVWLVRSETEPPETMHGVPVIWVDTSNNAASPSGTQGSDTPQPAPKPVVKQVTPAPPVFHGEAKTYTIPAVTGVVYRVGGVEVTGTRSVQPPATIQVVAAPMPGWEFPVGAQSIWNFTFEDRNIPFEDAVLPLSTYYRLDDAVGTKRPRDRGTNPLTIFSDLHSNLALGGPSIGVGASSLTVKGNAMHWCNFSPAAVTAFTWIAALQWTASAGLNITLGASQTGAIPGMYFGTMNDNTTVNNVAFIGKGVSQVSQVKKVAQPADGDRIMIGYTWDGGTLRGYVNGELIATAQWAGSTVASELIKTVEVRATNGKEWQLAGVGFRNGEAKDLAWMKAAYEGLKRG